jgi:hypothetical protein
MGLFDLFSNDTAEEAARQRNAGLQKGYDTLASTYGQGRDAINTGANTATGYYKPLMDKYAAGTNAYGDATGANGPEGYARAVSSFKTDPGYGFQMDQGQQALNRAHAAAGNLSSGNADADTLKFSQGLADQSFGNYVSRLQPYFGAEAGAVGGAANVATGQGAALNQNFMNQGNAANTNYTGQGASDAAATMNNYNVGANQLGALTSLASLAAGGAGGGLTGGLGGLFSGFGGTPTGATNPGSMGGVRYPQF